MLLGHRVALWFFRRTSLLLLRLLKFVARSLGYPIKSTLLSSSGIWSPVSGIVWRIPSGLLDGFASSASPFPFSHFRLFESPSSPSLVQIPISERRLNARLTLTCIVRRYKSFAPFRSIKRDVLLVASYTPDWSSSPPNLPLVI